MNTLEQRIIKKEKATDRNVYNQKDFVIALFYAVGAALMVTVVVQLFTDEWPLWLRSTLTAITLAIAVIWAVMSTRSRGKVVPYRRSDNFEFIGLYNLSEAESLKGKDILSREDEALLLQHTLETLIFPQDHIKQAICLTGRSGCGKSTILTFFKQQFGDQYIIFDMTNNYINFQSILEEKLGNDFDKELMRLTHKHKVVFILDQFERFFFLPEDKKTVIYSLIIGLCRRNTAIVISMREEFLAEFMKEFDVNNLKKDGRADNHAIRTGILSNLVSVIRDDQKNYHVQKNPFHASYKWREPNGQSPTVKNNYFTHLEHAGDYMEETVLEPVGNSIFFCENQNDTMIKMGGDRKSTTALQSKCEILFGEDGLKFYRKYCEKPLIEQQIIYQMAEYEKKIKEASPEELNALFEKEDYELLNDYFDIQLVSTGDYFNATRIMYLLSSARLNHVVMKREDVEFGLCENQFSRDGHKKIKQLINKLVDLQLIRENIKDSDLEYEIAHDFIGEAFLNYSNSSLDRNVKNGLDIYMADFMDETKAMSMKNKKDYFEEISHTKYFSIFTVISAITIIAIDSIFRFVYNPWDSAWREANVFGDLSTFFPLVLVFLCLIYIYNVYQKVLRFYRGKRAVVNKIVYAVLMVGSVAAIVFYPHSMLLFGFLLALMGLNCTFLLDSSYQKSCRRGLGINYGLKCVIVGICFAVLHLVMWGFNSQFPLYIILLEMAMICIIVADSYLSHMTREFLYGRLMDATSEPVTSER